MKRFPSVCILFLLVFNVAVRPAFAAEPMVFGGTLSNIYLKEDGTVWTWGDNSFGQLGYETAEPCSDTEKFCVNKPEPRLNPTQVEGLDNVKSVALYNHAVALKEDGTVWTWGQNFWGQLGYKKEEPCKKEPNEPDERIKFNTHPRQVMGISDVEKINVGKDFTIAFKKDGTIWGWGRNDRGQLGNGNTISQECPVQIREIKNMEKVNEIQGGDGFSLALTETVQKTDPKKYILWAWGNNNRGELGNGTLEDTIYPHPITVKKTIDGENEVQEIIKIYSGGRHSLAISDKNEVWSWGSNYHGELGNGTLVNAKLPVMVKGLSANITDIACDQSHSFALDTNGDLWAWGANKYGELGIGTRNDSKLPVKLITITKVKQIDTGTYHGIALKKDGTIWTWGSNIYGQLGVGNKNSSSIPIQVIFE